MGGSDWRRGEEWRGRDNASAPQPHGICQAPEISRAKIAKHPRKAKMKSMQEITFTVSPCEDSGLLVAAWDAPEGGGITTQGASVDELRTNIHEAVECHFEPGEAPQRIRLHFAGDVLLKSA